MATTTPNDALARRVRPIGLGALPRYGGSMTDRRATLAGRADDPTLVPIRTLIATRVETGIATAVILVALSRVDIVNAAYGRPTGDALIEAVGAAIARIATDTNATLAALGGVEFALGVPGDLAAAHQVAGCLTAALAEPFVVSGIRALVGHRIGLAVTIPGDDATSVLRKAREALTAAKTSDGTTMRVAAAEDVAPLDELAVDLHHAIERGEIDIVFQPQVAIATGRITGVEALARWDHGRLGAIGADTLFAAADRADLGVALSDHIQQLVLTRAAAWGKALGALRVALNLTAADVTRPGFAALFLARVDASGFPRGRLTIEITETGLIRDLPAVATLLADLRGAGCRVAIDDFGTGYSSLAYLKSLPLDYLKIDKSLTTDIDGSARDRVVVRGVIDIARALGVAVIAEGVETEAQLRLLAADGCDYYQGFLLAGALGETALAALMEKQ